MQRICVWCFFVLFELRIDFIGQLYMVAKSSQEESGKEAGEGVEIVKNIPYEVHDPINKHNMPKGQYTYVLGEMLAIFVCNKWLAVLTMWCYFLILFHALFDCLCWPVFSQREDNAFEK